MDAVYSFGRPGYIGRSLNNTQGELLGGIPDRGTVLPVNGEGGRSLDRGAIFQGIYNIVIVFDGYIFDGQGSLTLFQVYGQVVIGKLNRPE